MSVATGELDDVPTLASALERGSDQRA